MIADAHPSDSLSSHHGEKPVCSVPSIVHTITSNTDNRSKLQRILKGCVVLCWTVDEVVSCIGERLPHLQSICNAPEDVRKDVFPFILLYLFGGIYISPECDLTIDIHQVLYCYPNTIFFMFMATPDELAARNQEFGVAGQLMAASPRIDAIHTLLHVISTQQGASCNVDTMNGIISQFARAAVQGSKNDAVVILPSAYIDDPTGLCNIMSTHTTLSPAFAKAILPYLKNSNLFVMKDAPVANDITRLSATCNGKAADGEPIDVAVLDCAFDPEALVDASMQLAVQLHELSNQLTSSATIVLRKGCHTIAQSQLELTGRVVIHDGHDFSIWVTKT